MILVTTNATDPGGSTDGYLLKLREIFLSCTHITFDKILCGDMGTIHGHSLSVS
jgi:hypothetical protein